MVDCHVYAPCETFCFLQRIGQSLREGGPHDLKLERFIEAVNDEEASLSYRKSETSDVEQIISERKEKVTQLKRIMYVLFETGEEHVMCVAWQVTRGVDATENLCHTCLCHGIMILFVTLKWTSTQNIYCITIFCLRIFLESEASHVKLSQLYW